MSAIIFFATSSTTPRPIWAARPVSSTSATALTLEASPSPETVMAMVAFALPWPRDSRAFPTITARRAASSVSVMATVPS